MLSRRCMHCMKRMASLISSKSQYDNKITGKNDSLASPLWSLSSSMPLRPLPVKDLRRCDVSLLSNWLQNSTGEVRKSTLPRFIAMKFDVSNLHDQMSEQKNDQLRLKRFFNNEANDDSNLHGRRQLVRQERRSWIHARFQNNRHLPDMQYSRVSV